MLQNGTSRPPHSVRPAQALAAVRVGCSPRPVRGAPLRGADGARPAPYPRPYALAGVAPGRTGDRLVRGSAHAHAHRPVGARQRPRHDPSGVRHDRGGRRRAAGLAGALARGAGVGALRPGGVGPVPAGERRRRASAPRSDAGIGRATASFPSGHAGIAVAFYGGLALIILRTVTQRGLAIALASLCFAVPVLVAVTRLYRGMHFPTDLLGSWLLAGIWITVVVATLLPRRRAGSGPTQP